jgi:alpha-glucosidase
MAWLPTAPDVLAFARGDRFLSVTNMSADVVALPPHSEVLLTSADLVGGRLPPDATAWLRPRSAPFDEPLRSTPTHAGGG